MDARPQPSLPARPLPEAALVAAWLAAPPRALTCLDGTGLAVVHRGVPGVGPGPDVRRAILATSSGQLLHGDIEFHLDTSGWRVHGHQGDPNYDGVVLQVVARAGPVPADAAPRTAIWSPAGAHPTAPLAAPSCAIPAGPEASGRLATRLERKAAILEADCTVFGRQQTIWRATLDVLGYSRNRAPMVSLAELVPAASLDALARGTRLQEPTHQRAAWLAGIAGLAAQAARLPAFAAARFPAAQLSELEWDSRRVRPGNRPLNRLLQAAALHADASWLPAALDLMLREQPTPLLALLRRASAIPGLQPGLGPDRAVQLVTNLLLPLAVADGIAASALVPLLHRLRLENPAGRAVRLAAAHGLPPVTSAATEQLLLDHYDRVCSQTPCWNCLRA